VVVRLGERPGHGGDLAGAGYRRILQGQTLTLHSTSDAVVVLRAWIRVIYDDGSGQLLTVPETPRSGSKVAEALASADVISKNGWVVNAEVEMVTSDIDRGQTYVRLAVEPFGCVLLQDYCFSGFGNVSLGTFVQAGPGGGAGDLRFVTIKADGVPAQTQYALFGLSNETRVVHGLRWLYAASSAVATRLLDIELRAATAILPTGFDPASPAVLWAASRLTLTANEDGIVFADAKQSGINDDGTVAVDDAATAPTVFPLTVTEDDAMLILFTPAAFETDDFDTIFALVESWVLL